MTARQWHLSRAAGQRERMERVETCGSEELAIWCSECGHEHSRQPKTCGVYRLCFRCRKDRQERYRQRALVADRRHRRRLRELGLLRRGAPGGRWGRRLITLTVPKSGDPSADARECVRAWKVFRRLIATWIEKELLAPDCGSKRAKVLRRELAYVRVLEATPGTDKKGHAHLHIIMWSPFLPQSVIAWLWGRAIQPSYQRRLVKAKAVMNVGDAVELGHSERAKDRLYDTFRTRRGIHGRPLPPVLKGATEPQFVRPVCDVRKTDDGDEWVGELIKYLVKDAKWVHGEKVHVDPEMFGRLYAALDGRRCVVASRGFWVPHESVSCERCCGGDWSVSSDDLTRAQRIEKRDRALMSQAAALEELGERFGPARPIPEEGDVFGFGGEFTEEDIPW